MKKLEKISLANIKSKLNRNEMKNIMAGSGNGCPDGQALCLCDNGRMGCDTLQSCMQRCGL